MSTPPQRILRLLDEGARFVVELPGQTSIDLTPDVIAAMTQVQTQRDGFEPGRNLLKANARRPDLPTLVEFT